MAELLRFTPQAVQDVFVEDGRQDRLAQLARGVTRFVHTIDAAASRCLGPAHQGIVATAQLQQLGGMRSDLGAFLDEVAGVEKNQGGGAAVPLMVVLAGTQDPGNTGTMVRLADAMGAQAVIQTSGGADLWGPKVIRAAAGSSFHIAQLQGVDFDAVADTLRARGVTLLAADGTAEALLPDLGDRLAGPLAWVFGNEARGLSAQQLARVDQRVAIPMAGKAESLNVAAAAAIALYQTAVARTRAGGGAGA